jgi:ABC-2 type transport system permease protein
MGWSQATHPYSGDRWWPLLLSLTATAALVALAFALVGRRDLGAGLVQPRPGQAQAPAALGSPLGLAWRLQRGSVAAWATGIFLMSAAYGSMGDAVEELLRENPEAADWFEGADAGQLVDAYFAAMTVMTALIVAGFAVASVLRLRGEESAGRIEPVLATPTSRWGLIGSHLTVALAGSAALLALAGFGLGGALALTMSDPSQLPRLAGASMAYLPAVWLVAAATAALVGAAPSLAPLSWAYLSWCFVVAILGEQLRIPQWLRDTSAFEHIPLLPLQEMDVLPLAVVGVVAVALAAVGLTGFRRRDIETA